MIRRLALFFPLFLYSCVANAHVKWFVENSIKTESNVFKFDYITILLLLGTALYLGVAAHIEFRSGRSLNMRSLLYKPLFRIDNLELLKAGVIILLLGNIIQSHFLAPNLKIANNFFLLEQFSQAALIILIVFFEILFCIALVIVGVSLFYIFGFLSSIDYFFELLGIAFAVYFFQKKHDVKCQGVEGGNGGIESNNLGVAILRVSFGLQLCALAAQDKLLNPSLSLGFLSEYPYFNFMSLIGVKSFTDAHFVLAAGLAEFSMGILLVLNLFQRLAAITALFFFSLTSIILGPSELIGHVPVIIVLLIIINSPSKSLGFKFPYKSKLYRKTFDRQQLNK